MIQKTNHVPDMAARHAVKGNRHYWFGTGGGAGEVAMLSVPPGTQDGMVYATRQLPASEFVEAIQKTPSKVGKAIGIWPGVSLRLLREGDDGVYVELGKVEGASKTPSPSKPKKAKKKAKEAEDAATPASD